MRVRLPRHPAVLALLAALLAICTLGAMTAGGLAVARWTAGAAAPASQSVAPPDQSNPGIDPGTALGKGPAPGFTLTDQFGHQVSLAQFRGKAVILAFVDSHCTTICPLTTVSMVQALSLLGPAAAHVQLLGINANPTATHVSDVYAYSSAHHMLGDWHFLTGSPAQLAAVWRAYKVYAAVEGTGIDHEPAMYLIDPQGREREFYLTQMAYASTEQQAQVLADAAASVLPGHPRVRHAVNLDYLPGIAPSSPLTLPIRAGTGQDGELRLGPGTAHVVVFFASWLVEDSDLRAQLLALNRYVALARQHGWPSLVAIDEVPTEESVAARADLLRQVGPQLSYPVVFDTTGRLADGYGVQDQPWFAGVTTRGKIAFDHQGWWPVGSIAAAAARLAATGSH